MLIIKYVNFKICLILKTKTVDFMIFQSSGDMEKIAFHIFS